MPLNNYGIHNIIRSGWHRIESKLLWSCIPWRILCMEHLRPICYIETIKGVSTKFIASSHYPLHILEWPILSTSMFSFILLNKFRNDLILFLLSFFHWHGNTPHVLIIFMKQEGFCPLLELYWQKKLRAKHEYKSLMSQRKSKRKLKQLHEGF